MTPTFQISMNTNHLLWNTVAMCWRDTKAITWRITGRIYCKLLPVFQFKSGRNWAGKRAYLGRLLRWMPFNNWWLVTSKLIHTVTASLWPIWPWTWHMQWLLPSDERPTTNQLIHTDYLLATGKSSWETLYMQQPLSLIIIVRNWQGVTIKFIKTVIFSKFLANFHVTSDWLLIWDSSLLNERPLLLMLMARR